jgi:hypothetical protein
MTSSISGFSRSRYLRLMAISTVEVFGTVPLSTFFILVAAKAGTKPWKSWADTHSHYSVVDQVPGFVWKNIPIVGMSFEIYRWSLVASAFIFFALFGFAVEAREHYYRLYKLLTGRISTSSSTPHRAPHVYVVFCFRSLSCSALIHCGSYYYYICSTPSVPYVKRNVGGTIPIRVMVQMDLDKDNSSVSLTLTDQPSVLSSSMKSIRNSDSTTVQDSHSYAVSFYTAKSFDEPGAQDECQSSPPPGTPLTAPPGSVPPHFSYASGSTMPVNSSSSVETV